MNSATRSAIMIVGMLVLALTMLGITEASATRSPCDAIHAAIRIDHRHRIAFRADRAGRAGMEARTGRVEDLVVDIPDGSSPVGDKPAGLDRGADHRAAQRRRRAQHGGGADRFGKT